MKKILLSVIICFLLAQCVMATGIPVYAEEDNQRFIDAANKLKNLGIIKGTGQGFELDKPLSKSEASIIIVRLMQKEAEALQMSFPVGFSDVQSWARPYVGYLLENGLITGKLPSEFGANESITAEQFTESMLKILGYDVAIGDFNPGQVLHKAVEIGLITAYDKKSIEAGPVLNRKYAVMIAYNTLKTFVKDTETPFISRLIEKGSIGKDKVTIIWEGARAGDIIAFSPTEKTPGAGSVPIAFLGDSHTEGLFFVEKFNGFRTINKGLNGYTTRRILNRINEVVDEKPKTIFLMAGTNDIWTGVDEETTVKNYSLMLEIMRSRIPDCKIYIQSTFPFGEAALARNSKASNEKVSSLNSKLEQLAKKYNAIYLDIGSIYKDSAGRLDSRYSKDGVHILLEYYTPWISVIKGLMK